MYLPDTYCSFLERKGIKLQNPGLQEKAFKRGDALHAVNILRSASIRVSGGDVYVQHGDHIKPTYDSWSVRKEDTLEDSWKNAEDYIKNYPELDADEPLFVLVPSVISKQA